MNGTTPEPDPGLVYGLFQGIFKPQLIRVALQLDVFSPLAAGPATAQSVARQCQADPVGTQALLDYLCSLKVLERREESYALTVTSDTFLVRGRRAYVGDLILGFSSQALPDGVLESLRKGRPQSLLERFDQDAWLESYSAWRIPYSLELWAAAGVKPDPQRELRVLDLACGCAIKSLVLAQASPKVRVTLLDTPEVLAVARDLAERMQVLAQVAFMPASLLDADLGRERFDAVLLGQFTHYLTEQQDRDAFARIHAALSAGGVFVIDCPMATDPPREDVSFLGLVLWANSGGTAYPFATYRDWLVDAGFRDVRQLGDRWLAAYK